MYWQEIIKLSRCTEDESRTEPSLFAPTQRCSNFFYLFHFKGWKRSSTVKKLYLNKNQHDVYFPHISHIYSVGFPLHAPPPDALCLLKGDLLTVFTHDLWIISKVMHAAVFSLPGWPDDPVYVGLHFNDELSQAFLLFLQYDGNYRKKWSSAIFWEILFLSFFFHGSYFWISHQDISVKVCLCHYVSKVLKLSDMAQKRYANLRHTETQKTATRQRSSWNNSEIKSRHSGYLSAFVPHKHV